LRLATIARSNFCYTQQNRYAVIDLCALRKIQTALKQYEDQLRDETGLSLNEALCLCSINRGFQEPGSIAREMELSPSRLTRLLDALEGNRLVERKIGEGDRRNVSVNLTYAGRELLMKYKCSDIDIPEVLAYSQE